MNSGQSILVIGAFVILSTMTLNVNGALTNTSTTGLEMEATLDAISIAQSTMDEILTKDFDEAITGGERVYDPSGMTKTADFGPDGSSEHIVGAAGVDTSSSSNFESRMKFNDVDDYNGYRRKTWNPRFGWFAVSTHIDYADEDNANTALTDRTFYKRVTVTVSHPNMVKDSRNVIVPLVIQDLAVYRRYF